jgi:DNA-binding transcriptional MerR regulator
MAELSRRSRVPIPTIKYYIREGLLPPGERTGPSQALYSQPHLDRLALIRALRELAGLSIQTIRRICAEIDRPGLPAHDQMGVVADALSACDEEPPESPARSAARDDVRGFLAEIGWHVRLDAEAVERLVDALVALRAVYYDDLPARAFTPYANAALQVARFELSPQATRMTRGPDDMPLEHVVKGTILWEPVLLAFRRLAHEHVLTEANEPPPRCLRL